MAILSSPQAHLSGRLTNRCPGITPSQWKDTGSVFVYEFALLTRKCQVFLDKDSVEMLNEWAAKNMHQHTGNFPF